MSKRLWIVISDSGDGSNSLEFTLDKETLDDLIQQEEDGTLDDSYQSGDGLQIQELLVPDDATYESLGISKWSVLGLEE